MFCTWLKWWTQLGITAISPGRSPHWRMKSHSYLISRQAFFKKQRNERTKTVKYIVWFYYHSARCSYQGFEDHRKITMRARLNEFSKCSWKASRRKGSAYSSCWGWNVNSGRLHGFLTTLGGPRLSCARGSRDTPGGHWSHALLMFLMQSSLCSYLLKGKNSEER